MGFYLDTKYDTMLYCAKEVVSVSRWDRLIADIRALSKELRFSELQKVLESCGYTMQQPHGGSSHYTFRKPGCAPITIPKHEPIKVIYVRMVKEVIESEETSHENT